MLSEYEVHQVKLEWGNQAARFQHTFSMGIQFLLQTFMLTYSNMRAELWSPAIILIKMVWKHLENHFTQSNIILEISYRKHLHNIEIGHKMNNSFEWLKAVTLFTIIFDIFSHNSLSLSFLYMFFPCVLIHFGPGSELFTEWYSRQGHLPRSLQILLVVSFYKIYKNIWSLFSTSILTTW